MWHFCHFSYGNLLFSDNTLALLSKSSSHVSVRSGFPSKFFMSVTERILLAKSNTSRAVNSLAPSLTKFAMESSRDIQSIVFLKFYLRPPSRGMGNGLGEGPGGIGGKRGGSKFPA